MSNYFSCLATRSGLLNSPQSATSAIVPSFQKGALVSPHLLEIQAEHAMIETTEPVKFDAQPITHSSVSSIQQVDQIPPQHLEIQTEHAMAETAEPVKSDIQPITHSSQPSSNRSEDKAELPDSGDISERSSQPDIQDPIEKKQTHFIERSNIVVAERLNSDSVGSKQTGTDSQPTAPVPDSPLQASQTDAILADPASDIDGNRADVVRPTTRKINNISPSKNEWSNVDRAKTGQSGQPDSDPLIRVLGAHRTSRNDSKPSGQHEQAIAEQPFRQQSGQPSQINIQSITLEVHQAEPARVPAPAPRHHAPAPKQNPPSQTRLSRYYLKGW